MKVNFKEEPRYALTKDDLVQGEVYVSDEYFGEYTGDRPIWLSTDEGRIVELSTGYELDHDGYSDDIRFARAEVEVLVRGYREE